MDIKIEDGNRLCRLCAIPVENLGEDNDLFQINNIFMHQQIKELAGFMIENETKMPRHFCVNCKTNLSQAYEFRKHLIEVHKYFKKDYKKSFKNGQVVIPRSAFDTIFIPEKIEEETVETNSVAEDLYDINDFETIEAFEAKEEDTAPNESHSVSEDFFDLKQNISSDFDAIQELQSDSETELKAKTKKQKCQQNALNDLNLTEEPQTVNKLENELKAKTKKSKSKKFLKYKRKKDKKDDFEETGDSFICEQCGNSFKTMKFLEIHSVRHEEKKFQCDICPAKFFLTTELRRHKISHTGEKPVSCRFCDTRFLNKSNRNRHEKSQHLKLRPHPCELCGKAFANTHLRKNHMVVHTKERAFDCKLCQKSFLRKNHLVTHYKSTAHKKNEMDAGNFEAQSS